MGGEGDWSIESYRSFYESDEHWQLKKEFMDAHYANIPEDRLVCLAQVYANIELLGCRYPARVMQEVNDLSRGIGLNYKEKKKTKLQRTFVKASDAAGAKVRAPKGQKRKNPNDNTSHEPMSKKMVPFVKAGDNSFDRYTPSKKMVPFVKAEDGAFDRSEPPKKMMPFVKEGDSPSDKPAPNTILSFIKAVRDDNPNEEGEENEAYPDDDGGGPFIADKCMSFIKSMRGDGGHSNDNASGLGYSDPREKVEKYKKAVQQTTRQKITFSPESSNNQVGRGLGRGNFRSPRGRNASVGGKSKDRGRMQAHLNALMRSNDPLSEFILVQRVYANCDVPAVILEQSANFSHMPLEWTFDQNGQRCYVSASGIHIASARADCKKASKDAAAIKALEVLIERCFTLRILKMHSSTEEVSLSEVSESQRPGSKFTGKHGSSLDTPVDDTSIGNKLLKMMGWAGGGLGKDGSGISEPIKPAQVFGRQGLGHEGEQGVTKIFRNRIRGMLQDYLRGTDMNDLAFSPLFSKEQRAEIHKMARQLKLKSQSHGKGENRFLVLSRKFSPKQLIYRLLQEGPTDKYELIPPGEN